VKQQSNTIQSAALEHHDDLMVERNFHSAEVQNQMPSHELPGLREPPKLGDIRTLLVDSSPLMRKILAQILNAKGGFTVVGSATDSLEALERTQALGPALVLMDLDLPHMNGAQAASAMKKFNHPPVVFIVTADDSSDAREMSRAAGVDAFILKSANLHVELRTKLRDWFDS
jgi:CheY-like chemotaxis protein